MKAKFKATGRFDGAPSATVEIDRGRGTVTVRPHRRRTVYTVTLAELAEWAIWRALRHQGVPIPRARKGNLKPL